MESKAPKDLEGSAFETHTIKGYDVKVVRKEKSDEVLINGERQPVLKTEEGYRVGFAPVKDTLLKAVEAYLALFPGKDTFDNQGGRM